MATELKAPSSENVKKQAGGVREDNVCTSPSMTSNDGNSCDNPVPVALA